MRWCAVSLIFDEIQEYLDTAILQRKGDNRSLGVVFVFRQLLKQLCLVRLTMRSIRFRFKVPMVVYNRA